MAAVRSNHFYVNKYGEEAGAVEYTRVLVEREARLKRTQGNKTLAAKLDLSTAALQQQAIDNGDAVRCLECGYVGTRLQHTHFKYKCVGIFTSGTQYRDHHIGAKLVAPNLAKLTGGTLANYIALHGEEAGTLKWEAYKNKQATSNSLEYKIHTHGWTQSQYEEYNRDRSSTLENFIKRHGEVEGLSRWNGYVDRQRETTTLEYFKQKHGDIEGTQKYTAWDGARQQITGRSQSFLELECFRLLSECIPDIHLSVPVRLNNRVRLFDYGNIAKAKVVEFYGTYWHADPRKYTCDFFHTRICKSATEIWECDSHKRNAAKIAGYNVFIIWEIDWRKDKQKIITQLLEWWNATN